MKRALAGMAVLALALAAGASARPADTTPGLTPTSISIGGSVPLTGIASGYKSVALGAAAYFAYVNAQGGVNGRKIDYTYLDDAYDPSQTVAATQKLVEQDGVFAIFNTLGTETNVAVRDYLKQHGVPQLFVASGAQTWGRDYAQYPDAIGYLPSYVAEGKLYGRYLAASAPKARIGILFQNDAYTQDLIRGLKLGLGKKASQIVAQQGYSLTDTGVTQQLVSLKAENVDTLLLFATPTFTIQAYATMNKLGWAPKTIVNQVSSAASTMQIAAANAPKAVDGAVSSVVFKDPDDPAQRNDPGVKLYKQILAKYGNGADPHDVYNMYSMAVAWTFVDTLKHAGTNPTRASLVSAALHLHETTNPFLLSGIVLSTTPKDHFPIKQAQLERWHNGRWTRFGPLLNARG